MGYWAGIESNSDLSMIEAYKQIYADFATPFQELIDPIFSLFYHAGHFNEALELQDSQNLRNRLLGMGNKEQKDLIRYRRGLAVALGNEGLIYSEREEFGKAIRLKKKAESIFKEIEDYLNLQICYGDQATIYIHWNNLDKAMQLLKRAEAICKEKGFKDYLHIHIGNQAYIHYIKGEIDRAIALYELEQKMCRDTGDIRGLESSMGNLSLVYIDVEPQKALDLLRTQENICRERGFSNDLQWSLGKQAFIFMNNGNLEMALRLAKEKENICREIGLEPEIEKAIEIQNQIEDIENKSINVEKEVKMIDDTFADVVGPVYLNVQHKDNEFHTQYFLFGPSLKNIVEYIIGIKEIADTISSPKSFFKKNKAKCFTCGKSFKKCFLVLGKDVYEIEKEEIEAGDIQFPCDIIVLSWSLQTDNAHKNHPLMKKAHNEVVIFRNRSGI
ncbi:MAG: tetratricopeptide repeat protein [Deltaproteobacteria bacterium]|nr:tetratricopeptide repeat protein [Deltaproteobacteria bacterium]